MKDRGYSAIWPPKHSSEAYESLHRQKVPDFRWSRSEFRTFFPNWQILSSPSRALPGIFSLMCVILANKRRT
jgi:hypothetical protein